MNKKEQIDLIEKLKESAHVYYQGDSEIMSDEEYDNAIEYLSTLVDKGELELTEDVSLLINGVSAGTSAEGETIKHDYPMLSLGKAKNSDELRAYHKKLVENGAKGFRLEMKLDGLALSAKYSDGKLYQLATRGDGFEGESLNHLIGHKELTLKGLPLTISSKEELELRGEIYMNSAQFEEVNIARLKAQGESFSNSRNAISGIVKRALKGLGYKAEASFTAYSSYKDGSQVNFGSLGDSEGLSIASDLTENELKLRSTSTLKLDSTVINSLEFEDLVDAVAKFGEIRNEFKIPTDGVVIKPNNELEMLNKLGFTSHHPVAYIAYKYPGEKAVTEVLEILVSVGKTGRLTPQAKVKPVEVAGVVISNITCHNYSWLKEMGIKVGSKVAVTRANDVIPAIQSVVVEGDGPSVNPPKECPECGSAIEGKGDVDKNTGVHKTLVCSNEKCSSRLFFYIKSIVGRTYLDIDGLGDVALNSLINDGTLTGIVDIFKIKESELGDTVTGVTSTGSPKKLGSGNARNIMESINNSKEKTESYKLLASLNIPGIGKSLSKKLISENGGIENVLNLDPNELRKTEGVGETVVTAFINHVKFAKENFEELIELGFKINDPKQEAKEVKGSFSVSGSVEGFSNREDFVNHMENLGWEFHKSPKKDTTLLFADPNSTSSKVLKAKKNGTVILDKLEDINSLLS